MANQFFPLLPKLKESAAVTPDKSSVWETKSYNFLDSLIESLEVSSSMEDIAHIDSIPDVWAKPLLFEMALFDKQNRVERQFIPGLHDRVLGEWRCILAMLALNDIKHLQLRTEEVVIENTDNSSNIAKILASLAPKKLISSDTGWNRLYIIFYKNIPFALTSPTCLVCTSADYGELQQMGLSEPWSSNGKVLSDPIQYLTLEDLCNLDSWLENLHKNIKEYPIIKKNDNAVFLSTLEKISEYQHDIKCKVSGESRIVNCRFNSGQLKMNMGLFRYLDSSVQAKEASIDDSYLRLIPKSSKMREPNKNLLILSKNMIAQIIAEWNVSGNELIVWQGITANDVDWKSLEQGRDMLNGVRLPFTEIYQPDEFFTPQMAVIEPGHALPGSLNIRGIENLMAEELTPLLPIKVILLEYFTAEEISERVSLENTADSVILRFSFPLAGCDNKIKEYIYERKYAKADMIYLQKNVPVLEIWPDFRRQDWNKYYVYYENTEAQNKTIQDIGKEIFFVEPWAYKMEASDNIPPRGLANQYTARIKKFPEAFCCRANCSTQYNVNGDIVDAGLILLKQPPIVENNHISQWKIGVDFGTSSTMIFYKSDTYEPKALPFESHLFQVTDSGTARTTTYQNFIPSAEEKKDGSFLSIFHLLNTKKFNETIVPLQDGHIYQLENYKHFVKEGNRVESNLKWCGIENGRYKATSYLEQVCLQSTAEAAASGVAKVQWNFSYPTAFSDEERESFRQMCRNAAKNAIADSGIFVVQDFITESESVATALYFNKMNGADTNFGNGAICLDIGAGTTDISIISGRPGRIVYHTSIQFAGRILFESIYKQLVAGELFGYVDPEIKGELTPEQGMTLADAIMRKNSEKYLVDLLNSTGKESVKKMLQSSQLAMAGIFYYTGIILNKLHFIGIYKEEHVPNIYIGGNGSRIFNWLTGGGDAFDSSSIRMDVLKKVLLNSSKLNESFEFTINLSEQPKTEVASGMIVEKPIHELYDEEAIQQKLFGDIDDEYLLNAVISGENYKIVEQKKSTFDFMTAHDISAGIDDVSTEQLENFLAVFNKNKKSTWLNGLVVSGDDLFRIKGKIRDYYDAERGRNVKEIHVEPVFITALKKLMGWVNNG